MAEVVKNKIRGRIRSREKDLIFNVFKYFITKMNVSEAVRETSAATGCSQREVYRIRKEGSKGKFHTPKKSRDSKVSGRTMPKMKAYDDVIRSSIRRVVHDFFSETFLQL